MKSRNREILSCLAAVLLGTSLVRSALRPAPLPPPGPVDAAVARLLELQGEDGQWPYEGVYREGGEIPIGYRVGGTAIAATALLHARGSRPEVAAAVGRALRFVLRALDDPRLQASTEPRYDVRVWGQAYALEFLCRLRASGSPVRGGGAVSRLVQALLEEEVPGGGWNYASRRVHGSFVTAPVVQALLWARSQGEPVPEGVFARAREVLESSRAGDGSFSYFGVRGKGGGGDERDLLPGSVARAPACEATLSLLGRGAPGRLAASLDAFHAHWEELEKRRRQPGTHEGAYGIAPYYFYYGHRYAAQAIQLLPPAGRARERARLREALLRTRDGDGTWNDRTFPRSRAFGTSMAVLALLGDAVPLPP